MLFEWDGAKSAKNKLKHGVSFEEVEDAIEKAGIIDLIKNPGYEGQSILIFRMQRTIFAAYVERRGERVRIITAHPERKLRRKYGP